MGDVKVKLEIVPKIIFEKVSSTEPLPRSLINTGKRKYPVLDSRPAKRRKYISSQVNEKKSLLASAEKSEKRIALPVLVAWRPLKEARGRSSTRKKRKATNSTFGDGT